MVLHCLLFSKDHAMVMRTIFSRRSKKDFWCDGRTRQYTDISYLVDSRDSICKHAIF